MKISNEELEAIAIATKLDHAIDGALAADNLLKAEATTWDEIFTRNNQVIPTFAGKLNTIDHFVCSLTGFLGGVLDISKGVSDKLTNEEMHQKYDKLSKNKIKEVTGKNGIAAIDNRKGGNLHRMVGPSHDLFRWNEAIKQIMTGKFRSNVHGIELITDKYSSLSQPYTAIKDPKDAAMVLLLHLIGDFFSDQSLPIPGRTKIAESSIKEVVQAVNSEFLAGGNLRTELSTFISNLSGTVLISLIIRIYRYFDIFLIEKQKMSVGMLKLGDDAKFHYMMRNAQTIAFVMSIGKAAFTSNLSEINYTNFIQIVRSGSSINRISKSNQDKLLMELNKIEMNIRSL